MLVGKVGTEVTVMGGGIATGSGTGTLKRIAGEIIS